MSILTHIRTRWLIRQARHHAEAGRRLWLLSEEHHRLAGDRLDALERLISRR